MLFTLQTALAGVIAFVILAWVGIPSTSKPVSQPPQVQPPIASTPRILPERPAENTSLGADHSSYRSAVRAAMPSVVNIYTAKDLPRERGWPFGSRGSFGREPAARTTSLGSGVVWRTDGFIVTNNHVVDGADQIEVMVPGRTPQAARVIGTDPESDLAVLKIEATDLIAIPRGNSSRLEVGDVVLAIGNPFGVGQTVTQGIVSATGRSHLGINTFENFIQTDAAINPGNSGGALVDTSGRLAGINTAIYTQSEGSVGIGFAIPLEWVSSIADELIAGGSVKRGYLGIRSQDLDAALAARLGVKPAPGVVVAAIESGGPAARSGLLAGDVIRAIDDRVVNDAAALMSRASSARPGDTFELRIDRRGKEVVLKIKLGQRPALRPVPLRSNR